MNENDCCADYCSGLIAEAATLRARVEALSELVEAQDGLLACYRTGSPNGAKWADRARAAREKLANPEPSEER